MSTQMQRILEQYASPAGSRFYRHVMGDGSDHIHYGLYDNPQTQMIDALTATCHRLLEMALAHIDKNSMQEILDLGAGAGGPAKCLLSWTKARLTCVDLGEPPLQALKHWADAAKLTNRLRTLKGSFQELPPNWSKSFDLIWSQDALCHASDRVAVFSEAKRVLRANGVFVFSDILLSENAPANESQAFSSVNAVQNIGTPQEYARDLQKAGFAEIICEDWSSHLQMNFLRMLQQIENKHTQMLQEGISLELIDRFASSLRKRLLWESGAVLQWRAYLCR
jgi:SAM-dependent methyltransferase